MVVAAVFIVASAVVKADQCSSGCKGPGGNKPNHVVSMLQTKLQMSAAKDDGAAHALGRGVTSAVVDQSGELKLDTVDEAGLAADEALLKHVIEKWSVNPVHTVDRSPSSFRQRHQCQEEPLLATTFRSLDANTGGSLDFSDIPSLLNQNVWVIKFSIRDQKAVFDFEDTAKKVVKIRGEMLHAQLRALLNEVDLPDMDLMVSVDDASPTVQGQPGIIRTEGCVGKDLLMIPRSVLQLPRAAAQPPVCSQQYQKAVFRGGTTGPMQSNLRYFAANLSKSRPDLLDAGFTWGGGHGSSWSPADLQDRSLMKSVLTSAEQQCYSAVLVIDGHSVPDRLPSQLLWGLPTVFMHNIADTQDHCTIDEFWYQDLRPDVDFIKAKSDNLETVLENLLRDPERRTLIGQSGKKFVQKHLSLSRLKCYLHHFLSEYGRRYAIK